MGMLIDGGDEVMEESGEEVMEEGSVEDIVVEILQITETQTIKEDLSSPLRAPFTPSTPGARRGFTMLTTAPGARWRLPK